MSGNAGQTPNVFRRMRVSVLQGNTTIYTNPFIWHISNHPSHRGYTVDNGNSWEVHQVDLILSSGTYVLRFVSETRSPDFRGPLLDDVQWRLVPEPASLLVLGAGLAGLAGLKRRKR